MLIMSRRNPKFGGISMESLSWFCDLPNTNITLPSYSKFVMMRFAGLEEFSHMDGSFVILDAEERTSHRVVTKMQLRSW
jgi:hypothetical protein